MSLVVHCPKCQTKLRGPDDLAGRMVRCKSCQEKFRVPGSKSDLAPPSNTDTQQLSVVGSSVAIPTQAIPAKPLPALGTADNPMPLDDLLLEDAPRPVKPVATEEILSEKDLILEEPKPTARNPFTFEEPAAEPIKKKRPAKESHADLDDERPRKKPRRGQANDDDDRPAKSSYRQQPKRTPWALLIGVGVALLAIGGGVIAVVLGGGKAKDEAKAKIDPTPAPTLPEPKPRPKTKGPDKKGTETQTPETPGKPDPKKEPPKKELPKKELPAQTPVGVIVPPAPTGQLSVVSPARQKIAVELPVEKIRDLRILGEKVVVAVNLQPGFQGAGVIDVLRRYDRKSGAKDQRELQFEAGNIGWPRPFAAGEEGLVAVVNGGPTKITAYDFDSGNLLFDKLDAYKDMPDRVGPIAALALAPERMLYVVDQAGTVDVWNMLTRERQVTGMAAKRGAGKLSPPKACLMNSGQALAVSAEGKIWAIGNTGAMLTSKPLALPDPLATPLALGCGDGMDRVAVAYRTPAGRFGLVALRPIAGTTERFVLLPEGCPAPTAIHWAADTLVMVSCGESGWIFDLEERTFTAYLKGTTNKINLFPSSASMWWLTADTDPKKSLLLSTELPFEEYFNVRRMRANRQPLYLVPQLDGLAK